MSQRNSERGSAMLVTMVLISAILAGAAVLVSLQLGANRNTEVTRTGITALYCAEAGLTASRSTLAANQTSWSANVGTGVEPSFLSSINHDLDGGGNDFYVTLEDDYDEIPAGGGSDVPTADVNGRIYVVSRCGTMVAGVFTPKYADFPREVRELLIYSAIKNNYNIQHGGAGGNNNGNQ